MTNFTLALNRTALVCFSAETVGREQPIVVQVTIRSTELKPTVGTLATYFLVHKEIEKVVQSILAAHIAMPLPHKLSVEGEGYVLDAKRMKWKYGKQLQLKWGKQFFEPCQDKWIFHFTTK